MTDALEDLSVRAKLARVVLANRGPLSPSEVACEARLGVEEAERALGELDDHGVAKAVCSVCRDREPVYSLVEGAPTPDAATDPDASTRSSSDPDAGTSPSGS